MFDMFYDSRWSGSNIWNIFLCGRRRITNSFIFYEDIFSNMIYLIWIREMFWLKLWLKEVEVAHESWHWYRDIMSKNKVFILIDIRNEWVTWIVKHLQSPVALLDRCCRVPFWRKVGEISWHWQFYDMKNATRYLVVGSLGILMIRRDISSLAVKGLIQCCITSYVPGNIFKLWLLSIKLNFINKNLGIKWQNMIDLW